MKVLFLTLCLVTLASCGNKDDSTPGVRREDRGVTCGGQNASLCIPMTNYVIISHQTLPAKIKISRILNDQRFEYFNECEAHTRTNIKIERNGTFDRILFKAHSALFYEGIRLEISDLGEFCDKDAIFYDQVINPEMVSVGDNNLSRITLNN